VSNADSCWVWAGRLDRKGYGVFDVNGRPRIAHRIAYELAHGPLPTVSGYHGCVVMHKCDNPVCVNPSHLTAGSQADNMADKARKGRCPNNGRPGSSNPNAKLNDEAVRAIRLARGSVRQASLAKQFNVARSPIARIHLGTSWSHTKETAA